MYKKVLITGANGLLGQHLTILLRNDPSFHVLASGKGPDRLQESGYEYIELDITQKEEVDDIFEKHDIHFLINTAAMSVVDQCEDEPEAAYQINTQAVSYLADACQRNNTFFLQISTDFVFHGDKGMLNEEDMTDPVNYYGQTKLQAEEIVKSSPIKWAIIRTCLVYGQVKDMSRSNIILWVKKNLEAGNPIRVVDDQWRTPTDVKDLAKGCLLLIKHSSEGIFHISGQDYISPYKMAIMTAKQLNLDTSLISPTNASEFIENGKRPLKTGFDISKARKILGYKPISFEKGLQNFLDG